MDKIRSKYEIKFQGLEERRYEFDFEGDSDFFTISDQDIVEGGNFQAKVVLEKTATMLRLNIHIDGSVVLICDRSLEQFEEPITADEKYIYKFGDRYEVISEEMEIIPFGASEINISQHLFDYILLAVPMKKIHPGLRKNDDKEVEVELVFSDEIAEKLVEKKEEEKETDPRWAALQALKNKF